MRQLWHTPRDYASRAIRAAIFTPLDVSASAVLAGAARKAWQLLRVGNATSETADCRGVHMIESMAPPIVEGFSLEDPVSYPNAYQHVKTWIEEFKAQKKRPEGRRLNDGHAAILREELSSVLGRAGCVDRDTLRAMGR